jgi:hypothetical protein
VFHMDVAKVDRDVAHGTRLYTYVARVCSKCFICFRCMLKVFLSEYCKSGSGCYIYMHADICMLQAYVSSVSCVLYVCCKYFI